MLKYKNTRAANMHRTRMNSYVIDWNDEYFVTVSWNTKCLNDLFILFSIVVLE